MSDQPVICALPKKDVYVVDQSDEAAWRVIRKLCQNYTPGAVIPVSHEEFEALRDSIIRIELPEAPISESSTNSCTKG